MGRNANVFADNFMRGFSFVDEIKRRKKSDERLETRLAEEKTERAFQKRRTQENDKFVRADRANNKIDRERIEEERGKREAGEQAALNPDSTDEDLMPFVPFSPGAKAEMERRIGKERVAKAIGETQGIPTAGAAGTSNQTGGAGTNPSLSEALDAATVTQASTTVDPAAAASGQPQSAANSQFQFGRDQGLGGLQEIDVDEASRFDPEFQKKGFFGKVGDKIAGTASEIVRGGEDVVAGTFNAPGKIANATFGLDRGTAGTQNAGDEFGGNLQVPADRFTSPAEFDEMTNAGASQQEISAARAENVAVLEEYKRAGRRPTSMAMDSYSRQGALLEGSDKARRAAELAGQQAEKRATAFLDPSIQSPMEEVALQDPRAATVMYLEDRATLQGTNPGLALQMDRRMLPILDQAETDLRAETASTDPNSKNGRQQTSALANLQHSRNQIAKGQPSINVQADIKPIGVKVGDQPRVQSVADTIFDPSRPVPTQSTSAAINTAATVAGRISPNRRLNAAQTDALATLAQAGWIDKPTALSVMMTGAWPPGKDPNAIKKIQAANDVTYGITESGNYFVIQDHSKGANKGNVPNREIGSDQLDWAREGIRSQFPNMEENNVNSLLGVIYTNPSWVRSRFNVTSQEDMRLLGVIAAESKTMAGAKFAELDEGWFTNTKDAPTHLEVMMDPDMRAKLATELEMDYTPLPDVKDIDGIDDEQVRQNLRDGRAGPIAAANADKYTGAQALEVYGRNKLMELDAAGRLEVDSDGNITILPEPQAQ